MTNPLAKTPGPPATRLPAEPRADTSPPSAATTPAARAPVATTAVAGHVATDVVTKPSARRAAPAFPEIDREALAAHIAKQPWFKEAKRPVRDVEVKSGQRIAVDDPTAQYLLVETRVHFEDGTAERYLVPVAHCRDGRVLDALEQNSFKSALMQRVELGEQFEPAAVATETSTRARRRPGPPGPSGWLGAALAHHSGEGKAERRATSGAAANNGAQDATATRALLTRAIYGDASKSNPFRRLIDKGYTSPERFEHVCDLARLVSPKNADAIVIEFFTKLMATLDAQPQSVKDLHAALATRPRFAPVYYGYAQFMAVPESQRDAWAAGRVPQATFDDLVPFFELLRAAPSGGGNLASMMRGDDGGEAPASAGSAPADMRFGGVNFLPFYVSPQKDGGYDITNHASVDPALGGDEAHARAMQAATKAGLRVTADVVANHVGNEHEWVNALIDGNVEMLNRFVVWDDAVKIGEREVDGKIFNVFFHTKGEHAGKVSHVWQIFPENNPDTFVKVEVDGEEHNIYASFMNPFQWDVNIEDPQVVSYFLEVLGHFSNLGQVDWRFDASIHAGKKEGTFNIDLESAQAFAQLKKAFLSHIAPGNIVYPEANLRWDDVKKGWYGPERVFGGKVEKLAGDAIIGMDVHRQLLAGLLRGDVTGLTELMASLGDVKPHESILTYLTAHDEDLVEADEELRRRLTSRGFTDFAGRGVGDSLAELLRADLDLLPAPVSAEQLDARIAMAHVLLYSTKGHPAVYYRNVTAALNDRQYFLRKVDERITSQAEAALERSGKTVSPALREGIVEIPADTALYEQQIEARVAALLAAGVDVDLEKAKDSRDLDRGPIFAADVERALLDGKEPAATIRDLNNLWEKNGAVRTNDIRPLKNGDKSVWSFARHATDSRDPPLVQLVNTSNVAKVVRLSRAEVEKTYGASVAEGPLQLRELLAGERAGAPKHTTVQVVGDEVVVSLAPYQSVYLQREG